MSDIEQAIGVHVDVTIDWAELGLIFADEGSPEQADFLLSFARATPVMQLPYIAAEILDPAKSSEADAARVAQVLRDLAEHIDPIQLPL